MDCVRRRYVADGPSVPANQRGLHLVGNINIYKVWSQLRRLSVKRGAAESSRQLHG